jgi:hypothetical protein
MRRTSSMRWTAVVILAAIVRAAANGAGSDPCAGFKWDVSAEVAVMKDEPQALAAGVKPGAAAPEIKVGKLYTLQLTNQSSVAFGATPAKSHGSDDATAGIVRVHTGKAGRYRISITDGHWVDVVDGARLLKSQDFQGHVGCARPSKIVEFELPANRNLALQLSDSKGATVDVAVTAVGGNAAH